MQFGLKAHNIDPDLFDERIQKSLEVVGVSDYIAVSYTHLDVYKRQGFATSIIKVSANIALTTTPRTSPIKI